MKLRPFELTLIVVAVFIIITAVIMLRMYKGGTDPDATTFGGSVQIWGVLPSASLQTLLKELAEKDEGYKQVTYRYVSPESFDETFVNALADQKSPDLILISHEQLAKHRNRLQSTPYESLPLRDFKSTHIDGAEVFALSDGVYGWPVAVDPLVMYWNRDNLSSNGFLTPPSTWEEMVNTYVPALTKTDSSRKITHSALAMGEYSNIKNAFPIISTLLIQGGSLLVGETQNQYQIKLNQAASGNTTNPLLGAMTFYTNFSNITNTLYSWNRSLPTDLEQFSREELSLYFGYGSEGEEIQAKNPNLNFDVSVIPQGELASVKRTYGQFYGLAIPKASANKTGAYAAMFALGGQANAERIAKGSRLAPTNREALGRGNNDLFGRVSYASALFARGWLNPDRKKLDGVFSSLVEDVNANRSEVDSAVSDTITRIQQIY